MAIDPKLVSIKEAKDLPTSEAKSTSDFLFFEDQVLKKSPMSNIYDKVISGIKGVATQTNAPTTYTAEAYPNGLFETYVVRTPLTMPNSWGSAVTQAELDANSVYFDVKNGVISKEVSLKPITDPTKLPLYSDIKGVTILSDTQFIDDENADLIFRVKTGKTLNIGEKPELFTGIKTELVNPQFEPFKYTIDGFYILDTGSISATTAFKSTEKLKVKEGMAFINPFKGIGYALQAALFKKDGSFLSNIMGEDKIMIPALADTIGFTVNDENIKIYPTQEFLDYQKELNIKTIFSNKSIYDSGTDLSLIYKTNEATSENSTIGGFYTADGSTVSNSGFFKTALIPVREGSVKISGLTPSEFVYSILYDKNKTIVKLINHNATELDVTIPNYVAYLSVSNNKKIYVTVNQSMDMSNPVVDLPNYIQKITENKTIAIGDYKRLTIEFQSKIDLNNNADLLNVISGNLINFNIQKAVTSTNDSQHTVLNQSVNFKVQNTNATIYKELNAEKVRLFEGEELFRLRHTGTNYNLYWEVKNGFLNLYEGDTKLKGYAFSTYDTIGKLILKIKDDSDNSIIPSFEYFATKYSLIPTSKLASFEKLKASRTVLKSGTPTNTCFPTYFNSIDEKWHKLEFLFRENDYLISLDGLVWIDNGYSFQSKIGGQLVFDFTNFNFRNLELSKELDFSFPIIRTVYIHGAVDGIGESNSIGNTVDRTLEADFEFRKRGFESITYTQLMKHLKFGDTIPKRSYLLCYDDSRNDLYTNKNVRNKLIENNIKTNNCAVLAFTNDEEIYIKSSDVVFNGNIGAVIIVSIDSKLTYLGLSKYDGNKIFKLGNPGLSDYSGSIILNNTYSSGSSNVKFTSSPFILQVIKQEIPLSEFSMLIQEMPLIFRDYGFDIHIHDYRHDEALDTMDYSEALENVKKANEIFTKRYGFNSTGIVYPYGNITIDHARIWYNEGVHLGYTSSQNPNQIGLNFNVPFMLDRQQFDSGALPIRITDYFTNPVNGLDKYLP